MIPWWAPPELRERLEAEVGELVNAVDGLPTRAPVAIVDTRMIGPGDLAERRGSGPLVVSCAADEIDQVLVALRADDDIALHDEPAGLVIARARRALHRSLPQRDGLTGLLSRRGFTDVFDRFSQRNAAPTALLMFDIDHFKRVNDVHGHRAGDRVLQGVAVRLTQVIDEPQTLGRIGGEEFGAVLARGERDALAIAEAALEAVRSEPIAGIDLTLSAGVSVRPAASDEPARDVWRRADEALYAAKARGRDRAFSYAALEREATSTGSDIELESFENRTRVLADRVAEVIAWRGRRLFEELKEQADIDALTGLYSRRYLDRRLELEVNAAQSNQVPLSVALLDIDAFGDVNKRHGWPTGDRVLNELAERVRANVRADDWVARYGGEEICVVMLGATVNQAAVVLERIRAAIDSAPFSTTDGGALAITASLGAAQLDGDGDSVAAVIERASARLLAAKAAGKNQVSV